MITNNTMIEVFQQRSRAASLWRAYPHGGGSCKGRLHGACSSQPSPPLDLPARSGVGGGEERGYLYFMDGGNVPGKPIARIIHQRDLVPAYLHTLDRVSAIFMYGKCRIITEMAVAQMVGYRGIPMRWAVCTPASRTESRATEGRLFCPSTGRAVVWMATSGSTPTRLNARPVGE